MDLNLLPLFVAVAEAPTFTAAAQRLGLPRSSISRSIASLEKTLGVALFSRTTRRVSLTTAGTALLARVGPQLAELDEALGSVPEREQAPSGEIRISVSNDLGAEVLPSLATAFVRRHRGVRLDVRVNNRKVDLVAEGFDAALRIVADRLPDSSLVGRRLSRIDAQFYAAPTHLARYGVPRTNKEAAAQPWVVFRGIALPGGMTTSQPASLVCDDMLFLRDAIRSGAGLGLLPWFLAREDVAAGRLVRVLPKITLAGGVLYFVHPPARHVAPKIVALRDWLVDHFTAQPLVYTEE
jgi:DNA-binding transcriptional LysR family regulator